MCDYSLMTFKNRLAVCGDQLVVHRFPMSCLGLASAAEVDAVKNFREPPAHGFRERLKRLFYLPELPECPAVCVPPGARLLLQDISPAWQHKLKLASGEQEVVFTELATTGYRDAVRFPSGQVLLLQRLTEGQRVQVLALSSEEEEDEPVWARHAPRSRDRLAA